MKSFWEYLAEASVMDLIRGTEDYQHDFEERKPAPPGKPRSDRIAKGTDIRPIRDKGFIKVHVDVGTPLEMRKPRTKKEKTPEHDWGLHTGIIKFEFTVQSETKADETYIPSLQFEQIIIATTPDLFLSANPQEYGFHSVRDTDSGQNYIIKVLNFHTNPVKVHCDCYDFRGTFHYHNHGKGSALLPHDGPEPRDRKNELINPNQFEAMCKHLIGMTHFLEERGILKRS